MENVDVDLEDMGTEGFDSVEGKQASNQSTI